MAKSIDSYYICFMYLCLFIHVSFIFLSIVNPSIYLSIYLPIYLPIYLSMYLATYPSIFCVSIEHWLFPWKHLWIWFQMADYIRCSLKSLWALWSSVHIIKKFLFQTLTNRKLFKYTESETPGKRQHPECGGLWAFFWLLQPSWVSPAFLHLWLCADFHHISQALHFLVAGGFLWEYNPDPQL